MTLTRSRELGPAMRPVAVPDNLGSSTPKAIGRIELPLQQVLREGTESDVRFYVDADHLVELWDELVLPPAVREAWAARIAHLRDE